MKPNLQIVRDAVDHALREAVSRERREARRRDIESASLVGLWMMRRFPGVVGAEDVSAAIMETFGERVPTRHLRITAARGARRRSGEGGGESAGGLDFEPEPDAGPEPLGRL